MDDIQLFNDDCFNIFPTLEDKSINLFILDLPYGQTACKWDSVIDLEEMWKHIKRIMKPNALIVFFCTAKFGNTLINANPKWFKYDLIWKKSRKVGFLSANKMPLRQHENIYVFKDKQGTYHPQKTEGKAYNKIMTGNNNKQKIIYGECLNGEIHQKGNRVINKGDRHPTSIIEHENIYVFDNTITDDIELSRNKDLREYAGKVFKFIGKNRTQIGKKIGNTGLHHFYSFKGVQFGLPIKENYEKLIKEYNIDEMEDYLEYEILESLWVSQGNPTYNPQKTEGKEIKMKRKNINQNIVYGENVKLPTESIYKDRHPTSIIPEYEGDTVLVYKNPHKTIHRTQKPVELLEWLIKTYSNEGDLVMDFTMGSGTCGVACINTKRKFIGVEMDKEIYDACFDRIEKHKKNL